MELEISQSYIFYTTAREIWDATNLTYSHLWNDAQLYELKQTANGAKQGSMFVTAYRSVPKNLSQVMDLYQDLDWKCMEDSIKYMQLLEKDQVFYSLECKI